MRDRAETIIKNFEVPSTAHANEKISKKDPQAASESSSEEETVEELKVHQIELQMMNEELRRTYDEMETSRNLYQSIFKLCPVGIFLLTPDGRVINCNHAGLDLFGLNLKTLTNQKLAKFLMPADRDDFQGHLEESMESLQAEQTKLSLYQPKGNRIVPLDVISQKLTAHDQGNIILSIFVDKKDHVLLEEAKEEKNLAQKESHAKSDFLARASHEIRTPLHIMTGMAELLSESDLESEQRMMVKKLTSAGELLLQMLNDLLDLSKINASKLELQVAPFQPHSLSITIRDIFTNRVNENGNTLHVFVADQVPPALLGDESKLFQIITNLLSNANRFTSNGNISLSFDWVSDGAGEQLFICVDDEGPGIPSDQLEQIFSEFFQSSTKPNSQSKGRINLGTGLGLAISKSLTTLMGGQLRASNTNTGARFTLTLPLKTCEFKPNTTTPKTPCSNAMSGKRLLLIEDNEDSVMIISRHLSKTNIEVKVAMTGEEAMRLSTHFDFDLALIDVELPDINGRELFTKLRESKGTQESMLVAFSANLSPSQQAPEGYDKFDGLLSKPVSRKVLLNFIESALTA